MLSEQDRPGFQHSRPRLISSFVHGCANESSVSPTMTF
jgi:hypothetical protein